MVRRTCAVVAILAAGCGKGRDPAGAPTAGTPSAAAHDRDHGWQCELLPFAMSTPVPEASAAAWIAIERSETGAPDGSAGAAGGSAPRGSDGKPYLLVVGDSGNHGAYGIIDPDTGATIETGKLPLSDDAGDDLEGLSAIGDRIYGLTSSGWVRVWRRRGQGFELVEKAYPLGPVERSETGGGDPDGSAGGAGGKAPRGIDLPDRKSHDRPPDGDGMVCGARAFNCGRNYEGLCLAPAGHVGGCVGFAASKADGHLYCLTEEAGKLAVHRDRAIAITRPGALADCTFGDDGAMWAASNLFDIGRVYRVTHWEDPATAEVERIGPLPIGFPELIAVRGDIVYRMSDTGVAPSLMARYRCRR